ncbi:MAG: NUDIX domain-containing protein [Streptomycetales bacterium]
MIPQVRDEPERWPVVSSEKRFAGGVVSVRTDVVRMPGDDTAHRDVVMHPGSVGVIALDDRGRVLVVRQYRHPPGHVLWEPPAGLLDAPGEAPLRTAQRELHEEGHHRAADWRVLVDLFTSPGMSDEVLRIYLARHPTPVADQDRHVGRHEEADMEVRWVPLDELVRGVLAGELHNPTMAVGVLALKAALDGAGLAALRPAEAPWPQRG